MTATHRVPRLKNWRSWAAAIAAGGLVAGLLAAANLASAEPLVKDGVYGWGVGVVDGEYQGGDITLDNAQAPFVDVVTWGRNLEHSGTIAVTADGGIVTQGVDPADVIANMPTKLRDEHVRAIDLYGNNNYVPALAITDESGIVAWNDAPEPSQSCKDQVAQHGATDVQVGFGSAPRTFYGVVLLGNGKVCSWGGPDSSFRDSNPDIDGIVKIDASYGLNVVGLTGNGDVVVWGKVRYGQGDVPAEVEAATIVDVASDRTTVWALTDSGKVLHWGADPSRGFPEDPEVPGKVVLLGESTGNSAGYLAVTDHGEFIPWGGLVGSWQSYAGGDAGRIGRL